MKRKFKDFKVVPEHVEIRNLENPDSDPSSTAKLHLWIDLYPGELVSLPKPIDLRPQLPMRTEIRVIIYDIYKVKSIAK